MRYESDNLRRMLAAEYALGTLLGRARRRFERLADADGRVRAEIRYWEQRLAGLAARLVPVEPPAAVWAALERRLATAPSKVVPMRRPAVAASAPPAGERTPPTWRIFAGLATAAAVVVAVLIGQRIPLPPPAATPVAVAPPPITTPPRPTYVALLRLPESDMQWTLSLAPAHGRVTVAASGSYAKLGEHSLELWAITAGGPVSLGVLPLSGKTELKLPAGANGDAAPTLAVSLEPIGGSPTGKPTGPVLTSGTAVPSA